MTEIERIVAEFSCKDIGTHVCQDCRRKTNACIRETVTFYSRLQTAIKDAIYKLRETCPSIEGYDVVTIESVQVTIDKMFKESNGKN